MIFFTSDQHFGHQNIIKHCNRPFQTVYEMDETLIANYNEVVKPGDTVYHLGDFSYKCNFSKAMAIGRRLNGIKILILGNHDRVFTPLYSDHSFFKELHEVWKGRYDYLSIDPSGYPKINMFHYAQRVWNQSHRGAYALCGHSHGSCKPALPDSIDGGLLLDVGVDVHGYKPISIDEVTSIMKKKQEKIQALRDPEVKLNMEDYAQKG